MIIYLKQNTSSLPIALFSNKISPGFCINIAVNRGCYKYAKQLYTFCFNSSNTSSIIFSLIGNCFLLLFELKSDNNFYGFILLRKNYFWSRKRNLSFRIKKKFPLICTMLILKFYIWVWWGCSVKDLCTLVDWTWNVIQPLGSCGPAQCTGPWEFLLSLMEFQHKAQLMHNLYLSINARTFLVHVLF